MGTVTIQKPYSVGNLVELIINSKVRSKEDWIRYYFGGTVQLTMAMKRRHLHIHERKNGKFECSLCGYAGKKGKGLAHNGIDKHIQDEHKVTMSPEYFEKLVDDFMDNLPRSREEVRKYLLDAVISRTWDGHVGEKKVVEWIQKSLKDDDNITVPNGFKLKKTETRIDTAGMVDWYIECNKGDIGLQVKPKDSEGVIGLAGTDATSKHQDWNKERKGKVLWPEYSNDGEAVRSPELLAEIKAEIHRLGGLKLDDEEE